MLKSRYKFRRGGTVLSAGEEGGEDEGGGMESGEIKREIDRKRKGKEKEEEGKRLSIDWAAGNAIDIHQPIRGVDRLSFQLSPNTNQKHNQLSSIHHVLGRFLFNRPTVSPLSQSAGVIAIYPASSPAAFLSGRTGAINYPIGIPSKSTLAANAVADSNAMVALVTSPSRCEALSTRMRLTSSAGGPAYGVRLIRRSGIDDSAEAMLNQQWESVSHPMP